MRVAILFSGTGTNMAALVGCHDKDNVNIKLLLTNRSDAGGLKFARHTGIPTACVDHRLFTDRLGHEHVVSESLREHEIELICLAGYMRVLTPNFIEQWRNKIINIHPSLLPALPGLHTHQRALDLGVKIHGCTVHYVTERVDDGPILGQAAVPVMPDDNAESLAARVLEQEHWLYPIVLRSVCSGEPIMYPSASDVMINPPL